MGFTKYRFEAVVDFLEIEIQTIEPRKFWTIRDVVKEALAMPEHETPYVKPIDGDNHASCRFVIRVHDPKSAKAIDDLLMRINDEIPLIPGVRVLAAEISIDAYGAPPEFVVEMFNFITNHVSDNKRLYRDYKGSGEAIPARLNEFVQRISDGYQIGIGDKTADRYQHGYYKQTDGKDENGIPSQLDAKDHRPRFEIRLRGGGLPFSEWNDWRNFRFESLRREYFNFRKLKYNSTPELLRTIFENRTLHHGQKKTHSLKNGRTREFSGLTEANKQLNELVRESLRNLSKRWKPKIHQKVGRKISAKPSKFDKSDDSSYNYTSQQNVLLSIAEEIDRKDADVANLDIVETAPKDKDCPEKLSFQLAVGKLYAH
jgi:hypothetical protein